MIELQVTQGSPEWLAARAKCFTASEASAMMGESAYQSRSALLHQKSTGIVLEVDAATQVRFDMGHVAEALAREVAEEIIGEGLYPIVATDDSGKYLASSDGATMLCDNGWEHKLLNSKLVESVKAGIVPTSHKWQLVHQCMVFGFERIMFSVSDGTRENHHYCWFVPTDEDFAQLKAGWDQFAMDLAAYVPEEVKPAAVAEVIEDLPALTVQLVGQVTASNLADFKMAVTARIKAINTTLVTDSDFATADKMVKFLDDGEKRLDLVKSQALAQTSSIDELFRTIDALKAEMRNKRLTLDKLVKAEKENRKAEIVREANAEFSAHIQMLDARIGMRLPMSSPMLADSIKGMKSLDSMRDKLSVALANAKVEANSIADRIETNRKTVDDMSLFPDFAQVCIKAPEDFAALMAMRIGQRKEAEEKRLAVERERIRAEEQADSDEQMRKIEHQRMQSEAKAVINEPAPVINESSGSPGQMMKLGEINARLGYIVSAEFLSSLGFVATTERSAKLYRESDFQIICRKIADHTIALAFKEAA